jgi:hypothetical protein
LESSPAYQAIRSAFGTATRLRELKAVVNVIRAWWQVKDGIYLPQLSRNEKRSFLLLVKYIDLHYDQIVPLLRHVVLLDDERKRIPLLDQEGQAGQSDLSSRNS